MLLLLLATGCGEEAAPVFPDANLLLVSIDTLRADRLGCYGYARPTSPFLDQLASESILFEEVIAQSTWTTPSHAALMTSRYPSELGLGTWPDPGVMDERYPTLAELLSAHGLATHSFTESAWIRGNLGFSRGFDECDDRGGLFRQILPRLRQSLPGFQDRPFFVFLHTYDVHWYDPPDAGRDLLRSYQGSVRPSDDLRRRLQGGRKQNWLADRNEEDQRYVQDLYDASIRYVDGCLEQVVRHFKNVGLWDRTLLVITSDHGEEFLEHGRTGHGYSAYDEQLRVPLLIRLPGNVGAGRRVREQVRSIDIMPTLLELLDVRENLPVMQGTSLVPAIFGTAGARPAFTDRGHTGQISLRSEGFKAIYDTGSGGVEVYDLRADPSEQRDLAPAGGDRAAELTKRLKDWYETLERPARTTPMQPMTEAEISAMRALGYVDDDEER